jgi:predicted ArsR family transcriptional regulator
LREPFRDDGRRSGTRERILRLLLSRGLTIESLSHEIGITRNAVRAQIALLRTEGVVEAQGEVKGTRRPSAIYRLLPGAEIELSRAYPVVVSRLVAVLARDLSPRSFDGVMRKMGRQLAEAAPRASGGPAERVRAGAAFFRTLGSMAEVSTEKGSFVIHADGCPISAAVEADDRACAAMASMLQELTALPVREACTHADRPRCRFVVGTRPVPESPPGTKKRRAPKGPPSP